MFQKFLSFISYWFENRGDILVFLRRNKSKVILSLSIFLSILVIYKYYKIEKSLPNLEKLANYEPALPTIIYSQDSVKLAEFFVERRYPIPLSDMSPFLKNAFVAAEDADFYNHSGLDWTGIMRAVFHLVTFSNHKQGGSTITQQLAKNVLLTKERTITRKIKDIIMARKIENYFSKDKILELYLNTIYLGNGAYGVEAASQNYFRKSSIKLSLGEAAMIAGLTPAPSAYDPNENSEAAKVRQNYVLERMLKKDMITQKQYERAINEKINFFKADSPNNKIAPYFVSAVKKQLENQLGVEDIDTSGMSIYTTLNSKIQNAAVTAIQNFSKYYEGRKSFKGPIKHHNGKIKDAIQNLLDLPINDNENDLAIVVSIDEQLRSVGIVSQRGIGVILAEDIMWALNSGRNKETDIEDINYILKVGDEIHVQKVNANLPRRLIDKNNFLSKLQSLATQFSIIANSKVSRYTLSDSSGIEVAALVMDGKSGEVLAMVGGENFLKSQFNRTTQAERQVGSSVKPLYYSFAIDNGFSPASYIDSPKIDIDGWQPENYDGIETERVTLRRAMAMSYNIPSIFLFQTLGSTKLSKQFQRMGFNWPAGDLSIALGSGTSSLLKMVQAYSIFPNQGKMSLAFYINEVVDRKGNVIFSSKERKLFAAPVTPSFQEDAPFLPGKANNKQEEPNSLQIISPQAAYVSLDLLRAVVTMGTGHGVQGIAPQVGGKTGTTNGNTDAWFIGLASQVVGGVWVGFDDNSKTLGMGGTGAGMAAPIWRNIMYAVVKNHSLEEWTKPSGITELKIDKETGEASSFSFNGTINVPIIEGTQPGSEYARNALSEGDNDLLYRPKQDNKNKLIEQNAELPAGVPNPGTSSKKTNNDDNYKT